MRHVSDREYKRWAEQRPKVRQRKKKPSRNRHHLTPKSRNGKSDESNLLYMKVNRHSALHKRFGLMTIEEIRDEIRFIFGIPESIEHPEFYSQDVIDRLCQMKGRMAS